MMQVLTCATMCFKITIPDSARTALLQSATKVTSLSNMMSSDISRQAGLLEPTALMWAPG